MEHKVGEICERCGYRVMDDCSECEGESVWDKCSRLQREYDELAEAVDSMIHKRMLTGNFRGHEVELERIRKRHQNRCRECGASDPLGECSAD